jgi:ABC-type Mn2+/Zn2+ transport system permease subunit
VRLLDIVLMMLVAASVAVAVRAVGSLLVASLLLVPSATARLVTRRIPTMHLVGIAFAAAEGVAGLWVAYRLDAPPGAGIAVVAASVFVVIAVARTLHSRRGRHMAVVPI